MTVYWQLIRTKRIFFSHLFETIWCIDVISGCIMTSTSLSMKISSWTESSSSLLPLFSHLEHICSSMIHFNCIVNFIWSTTWELKSNKYMQNNKVTGEKWFTKEGWNLWKFPSDNEINTLYYPKRDPRNPFDELSFFSASAINCIAFCSLSAMILHVF